MAYLLTMADIQAISRLHQQGWSQRRIARELDVDRETVAKYVRASRCNPKAAKAPLGSDKVGDQAAEGSARPVADEAFLEGKGLEACPAFPLLDVPPGQFKTSQSASRLGEPKPAKAPIGSPEIFGAAQRHPEGARSVPDPAQPSPDLVADIEASTVGTAAEAVVISSEQEGCRSACEPYRQVILEKLEQGLSGQRIWQDLRAEGFKHEYHSVRRFVAKLRGTSPLPFRRMEWAAGEEAQVDFGTGAWIELPDGKRRRSHVFRIVLSYSRKAYYSVPPEYLGHTLWVRWDLRLVRIFNGRMEQIAVHVRQEPALRKLRLSGLSQTLEVRLQEAASHHLSHVEFLELILQDELTVRSQRLIDRRVKAAGFRELKPLEDFDFSFNPSIKKKQVCDLATCRFIREHRDVLWMGPPGVGKSFLVQALGYQAIKLGFVVLYRSIFDVVRDFLHDEAFGGEERMLSKYLKPDLLIVDDMGMKQLPKRSGEYLFEIIMRRYETRSTMMTSNRPLEDWGKLIGDVPSATAILDRFLHHAEIVTITGRSYRLRNQGNQAEEPKGNGLASKEGKRSGKESAESPSAE